MAFERQAAAEGFRLFAFAASVPATGDVPHGLPVAPKHPDHVNQNPLCEIDDVVWFGSIRKVWDLSQPK